jgi:ABC-type multidrug transport system ATPase subunit
LYVTLAIAQDIIYLEPSIFCFRKEKRLDRSVPAVVAEGISKTYNPRSKSPAHALRDVAFSVQPGEVVGLIGPNGAGKSTLLRILLGFLNADSGRVMVFGEHPESLEVRHVVGYQADTQFRSKSINVRQFLALHAALLGANEDDGQIEDLLKLFSLHDAANRPISALSKGMRQKLELVLAFLGTPQIVFLDEPTASLDPPSIFELRDFLAARKSTGITVFFSSHNLTEVENVCDRVLFILEGSLVADYAMMNVKPGFLEEAFRKHLVERRPA